MNMDPHGTMKAFDADGDVLSTPKISIRAVNPTWIGINEAKDKQHNLPFKRTSPYSIHYCFDLAFC